MGRIEPLTGSFDTIVNCSGCGKTRLITIPIVVEFGKMRWVDGKVVINAKYKPQEVTINTCEKCGSNLFIENKGIE